MFSSTSRSIVALAATLSSLALVACNTTSTVGANDPDGAGGSGEGGAEATSTATSGAGPGATSGAGATSGSGDTTSTTSSAQGTGGGGGDEGTGAGGGGGGGSGSGGAPACTDLASLATEAAFELHPLPAPEPAGGDIADGIYVLTEENVYASKMVFPGGPLWWTLEIAGDTMSIVHGFETSEERRVFAITASDRQIDYVITCDSEGPAGVGATYSRGYTADADRLLEYLVYEDPEIEGPVVTELVWTRLP